MQRYLRLFLCLPLLATTACAADAIAGPRLAPAPEADAIVRAAPNPAYQGCIVPPERVDGEMLYIVDGVIMFSLPELAATDIESVEVRKNVRVSAQTGPRVMNVTIITTRSATRREGGARQ